MSTITKISRRSPRLMEKEAVKKIAKVLASNGFAQHWVFDDALFKLRWEYDEMLVDHANALRYCMGCSECHHGAEDDEREYTDILPYCSFTKEETVPVMKELLDLATEAMKNKRTVMTVIYATAVTRFIHGPARCLLKFPSFRAMTKEKCSSFPQEAMRIGVINTEMGERLADACWAVAAIINQLEDEDGCNIFHGY
jgi:hypothetical protein